MNRTIKFRAWDAKNGRFRFGNDNLMLDLNGYLWWQFGDNEPQPAQEEYALERFTGVLDKNGVEIFEGDIVSVREKPPRGNYPLSYVVLFNTYKSAFRLRWADRYTGRLPDERGFYDLHILPDNYQEFEVIGNIHQHPELLK